MRMCILKSRHQKISLCVDLPVPDNDIIFFADSRSICAIPDITDMVSSYPEFPLRHLKGVICFRQ